MLEGNRQCFLILYYVNLRELREFSRLFFGDFHKISILQIVSKYFILAVARLSGKSVRPVRDLARVFFTNPSCFVFKIRISLDAMAVKICTISTKEIKKTKTQNVNIDDSKTLFNHW